MAANGLGLIRLEPGPSASPPCQALPTPAPPSWRPGDLPESLPARNTGLVQKFERLHAPRAWLVSTVGALASAPCGSSEPRPDPAGIWARDVPASMLAAWRVGSSGSGPRAACSPGAGPWPHPTGLPPVHLSPNAACRAAQYACPALPVHVSPSPQRGVCLFPWQADRGAGVSATCGGAGAAGGVRAALSAAAAAAAREAGRRGAPGTAVDGGGGMRLLALPIVG